MLFYASVCLGLNRFCVMMPWLCFSRTLVSFVVLGLVRIVFSPVESDALRWVAGC